METNKEILELKQTICKLKKENSIIKEKLKGMNKTTNENNYLREELAKREIKIADMQSRIKYLENVNEKLKRGLDGANRQMIEVQAGRKIAFKEKASYEAVLNLYKKGYNQSQMANKLGVSRGTIANRLAVLKKRGII